MLRGSILANYFVAQRLELCLLSFLSLVLARVEEIRLKKGMVLFFVLAFLPATVCADKVVESQIVTFKGNVVKCLAPVAIRMIDGKLRQLPTTGFKLEPGFHTLAGEATTEYSSCPRAQRRSRKHLGIPAVEWFFEAGKVYYVALDHHYLHEEEWRLVVWKVESADGELVFDITRPKPVNQSSEH